ncbi:MAG: hypothetical protein WBO09_03320 [Methylocystis silviterrae]|uniref:hypothetical protein n=1 Tax=Methylocystis silviterrae TaxID=2743612 RepID=UPI003C734307
MILLFDGASYAKQNQPHKSRKAGDPERQQIFPNFPAFGGAVGSFIVFVESPSIREGEKDNSTWNSKECPEAKSHDDADLCEQRRMSKAADDSVSLNKVQVLLGVAGFLALLVTIWLTYRATSAAIESNKIASDTAKRELRAYVHVCKAKISNANSEEWGPSISIGIQNFGQTPAYSVVHRFNYCFQMLGEPRFDKMIECRHSDIGPSQAFFQSTLIPLAQWEIHKNHIASGRRKFFFFGEITYIDVFDKTITRATRYRLEVMVDDEGIPDGSLVLCQEGNSTT